MAAIDLRKHPPPKEGFLHPQLIHLHIGLAFLEVMGAVTRAVVLDRAGESLDSVGQIVGSDVGIARDGFDIRKKSRISISHSVDKSSPNPIDRFNDSNSYKKGGDQDEQLQPGKTSLFQHPYPFLYYKYINFFFNVEMFLSSPLLLTMATPPTVLFLLVLSATACQAGASVGDEKYVSALGDPGMRRDGLRVALEGWNFCNEVGEEAPKMGSPRAADCFDVVLSNSTVTDKCQPLYKINHLVTEKDNKLGVGDQMDGADPKHLSNVDLYAVDKELYLGKKCEVHDTPEPWQFWMIMLKNGNMDTSASLCPSNGHKVGPFPPESRFPCFGRGCMNQPLVYHDYTDFSDDEGIAMRGKFYGTYDLDADLSKGTDNNISYFSVTWEKYVAEGSWSFHHVMKTSKKYPWLMLYLRSDATKGLSGGYHYPTRGMTKIIPESPNFMVKVTLDIKQGGGPKSQFYLMDMGSCWKNNGDPCDGDVTSDVTRYSEMILNPDTEPWCQPNKLHLCPPYHTLPNGTRIHRTDKANFPYGAYHMYCSPGNGKHIEEPYNLCDAYSNPQPQEILQILPHPVWGDYGYPTKQGEGWIGDPRSWTLDVGRLSQALYFYQDPGTPPVKRRWSSLDVGTEIYVSDDEVAEWTISDFDIIVPNGGKPL